MKQIAKDAQIARDVLGVSIQNEPHQFWKSLLKSRTAGAKEHDHDLLERPHPVDVIGIRKRHLTLRSGNQCHGLPSPIDVGGAIPATRALIASTAKSILAGTALYPFPGDRSAAVPAARNEALNVSFKYTLIVVCCLWRDVLKR